MPLPCEIETAESRWRRYTAFHEAGHAIAGLALGRRVLAVSIQSDNPICLTVSEPRSTLHDALVLCLAGDAAERVMSPDGRALTTLDRKVAASAIVRARDGHRGISDAEKEAEMLVRAAGSEMSDQQLVDLWFDFEWLTERYFRKSPWRVWTKVVAERLLKHENLFDFELEDIPRDRLAKAMHDCGKDASAPVTQERKRHMSSERHVREASIKPSSFNAGENTVNLIWSTGAAVRRYSYADGPYDELLDVTPSAVRLDRLNAGAPLLNTHSDYDLSDVIGCVVPGSAKVANGIGTATVKLSSAPADADIVAKIKDGIIRNVSVGYTVYRYDVTPATATAAMIKRAVDWEPMELSFVPVPADAGATVRSNPRHLTGPNANVLARMRMRQSARRVEGLVHRLDDLAVRIGLPRTIAASPPPPAYRQTSGNLMGRTLASMARLGM
jgi:hypothetical protein